MNEQTLEYIRNKYVLNPAPIHTSAVEAGKWYMDLILTVERLISEINLLQRCRKNIREFIQEELDNSPPANYEENDYNAGYQEGIEWILKYLLKGGESDGM